MRRISFAMTTGAIENRTKTVTRRLGWKDLEPGTRLLAVDKLRTKNAKKLAVIKVTSVRAENLRELLVNDKTSDEWGWYTEAEAIEEIRREGLWRSQCWCGRDGCLSRCWCFVNVFCDAMKCTPDVVVTRIEFRYVEDES